MPRCHTDFSGSTGDCFQALKESLNSMKSKLLMECGIMYIHLLYTLSHL